VECPGPAHYRCGPAAQGPGTKLWSFPTDDQVYSSPTLSSDGTVVYVGSNDGNLYAVHA
jgi:outer membrane protein assembly factor BamB